VSDDCDIAKQFVGICHFIRRSAFSGQRSAVLLAAES
jgi:hypothetical protein